MPSDFVFDMRTSAASLLLFGVGLVGSLACEEHRTCPAIERGDEVVVTVRDVETKASICDAHVFVSRTKSAERIELPVNESCVYRGRVGIDDVYSIDVSHPTHASARREGIRASRVDVDGCQDSAANVDVELDR